MLEKYKEILQAEFDSTLSHLDTKNLEEAKALILSCEQKGGRVHVTGIGKPSYVAGYAASLLSSTGTPSYFLDGTEAIHGSSGQVLENDVVIALSNSGETKELLTTIETLKVNQAKIISISRSVTSSLSMLADVAICSKVDREGDNLNKPPRASIISEMIALQSLSILLQASKNLDIDTYVKWHPGGSIGDSIIGHS